MPNTISMSTEGMFVFFEIPLNQKDRITIMAAAIIKSNDDTISIEYGRLLIYCLKIAINR
jgi:hypothetical protein